MKKLKSKSHNILELIIIGALIASVIIFVLYPFICMMDRSIHIDGYFSVNNYISVLKKYNGQIINSLYAGINVAVWTSLLSVIVTIFITQRRKVNHM